MCVRVCVCVCVRVCVCVHLYMCKEHTYVRVSDTLRRTIPIEMLPSYIVFIFIHTPHADVNLLHCGTKGVCHCHPGYVGGNCSFLRSALPQPYHTAVKHSGLCEVSARSNCRDIFVSGQGFIDSSYLSCHIQSVEVGRLCGYVSNVSV